MDKDFSKDLGNPAVKRAMELAREFSKHCKMEGLPNDFMIYGVVFNIEPFKKDSFDRGFRDGRMSAMLKVDVSQVEGLKVWEPAWKQHAQQLVLSEDRKEYLRRYL